MYICEKKISVYILKNISLGHRLFVHPRQWFQILEGHFMKDFSNIIQIRWKFNSTLIQVEVKWS